MCRSVRNEFRFASFVVFDERRRAFSAAAAGRVAIGGGALFYEWVVLRVVIRTHARFNSVPAPYVCVIFASLFNNMPLPKSALKAEAPGRVCVL